MQEMVWLKTHFPKGDLQSGIDIANELYWNISVEQQNDYWRVLGGDKVIFWSDNKESVDAFLYGLSLAYCAIPEDSLNALRDSVRDLVE